METPANAPSTLSKEQELAVLSQLDSILQSDSFRKSKRYPAMLEYCVLHSIRGDEETLRERQLGITIFARPHSYDTSADPIVRMAASEIRKRLAQYYDAIGEDAKVKISIPPGSYVAEFRFLDQPAIESVVVATPELEVPLPVKEVRSEPVAVPDSLDAAVPVEPASSRVAMLRPATLSWAAWLLLVCGLVGYRIWSRNPIPGFWQGALEGGGGEVVLVVGQLPGMDPPQASESDPPLQTDIFRPNRFISLGGAASAVSICSVIARTNLNCELKPAASVDLSSVQKRPAIFQGAYNNPWTLRVSEPLPYRFGPFACKCILDSKSGESIGNVDFSIPRNKIFTDYSIVARFHSEITDGPAVVIAGIGPMSTEAAAGFLSSAQGSEELLHLAPKGWKGGNVEAVLGTDVVNGVPGHTHILRTAFW